MREEYIQVKNLSYVYGELPLFSPVSFGLKAGSILQVTGKNGSGKTTLLQLLAGLKQPRNGSIERKGETSYIYIGHKNALKAELSPLENLSLYQPVKSLCVQALEEMGLEKIHYCRPCYMLSEGQRRKTALARLLLADAKLWLLDEPFAALDEASKKRLGRFLERHAKSGGGAVVATHEPLDVDKSLLKELVMA